jgi:hypothetical protein
VAGRSCSLLVPKGGTLEALETGAQLRDLDRLPIDDAVQPLDAFPSRAVRFSRALAAASAMPSASTVAMPVSLGPRPNAARKSWAVGPAWRTDASSSRYCQVAIGRAASFERTSSPFSARKPDLRLTSELFVQAPPEER